VFYLVFIWLNPGQAETLRAYERLAAPIMRAHGGELERVFHSAAPDQPTGPPDEVHLLRFADPDGFERFRADPALQPAVPLREAAVRAVQLLPLREQDLGDYLAEG
jgi:uncharacterized protein (DUF1330 family)